MDKSALSALGLNYRPRLGAGPHSLFASHPAYPYPQNFGSSFHSRTRGAVRTDCKGGRRRTRRVGESRRFAIARRRRLLPRGSPGNVVAETRALRACIATTSDMSAHACRLDLSNLPCRKSRSPAAPWRVPPNGRRTFRHRRLSAHAFSPANREALPGF
jgi:hypothetical protein